MACHRVCETASLQGFPTPRNAGLPRHVLQPRLDATQGGHHLPRRGRRPGLIRGGGHHGRRRTQAFRDGRGRVAAARHGPARQDRDHTDQAPDHPARPVARLLPWRCGAVPYDPRRSGDRLRLHGQGQPGRRHLQRHRSPRPRQHWRPGREAGDGRQVGAVQALRRHRRHRPGGRHHRRRRIRQQRALSGSQLRRHQPGGHQGAGVLHHRGAPARVDGHPGLSRRPARHRHRHRRRPDQRPAPDRTRDEDDIGGRQWRRRGGAGLRRALEVHGPAREPGHHLRPHRRHLSGPPEGHEPMEGGARRRHQGAHLGRGHAGRRRLSRPVGKGRGEKEDGRVNGRSSDRLRHGQPGPGDPPREGKGGTRRRHHRHRALGLSEPGQQRSRLSLHLPRRAGRARQHHQRGDEDRRRRGPGGAGARGRARRGRRRLCRPAPAIRPRIHHPGAVRFAAHRGGAAGRGQGRYGLRRRAPPDQENEDLQPRPRRPARPHRLQRAGDLRCRAQDAAPRRLRRGRGREGDPRRPGLPQRRPGRADPDRTRGHRARQDRRIGPEPGRGPAHPQRPSRRAARPVQRFPVPAPAAQRIPVPRLPAHGQPEPQRVHCLHGRPRPRRRPGHRPHALLLHLLQRHSPGLRPQARRAGIRHNRHHVARSHPVRRRHQCQRDAGARATGRHRRAVCGQGAPDGSRAQGRVPQLHELRQSAARSRAPHSGGGAHSRPPRRRRLRV